jgi:hypothetical protein
VPVGGRKEGKDNAVMVCAGVRALVGTAVAVHAKDIIDKRYAIEMPE